MRYALNILTRIVDSLTISTALVITKNCFQNAMGILLGYLYPNKIYLMTKTHVKLVNCVLFHLFCIMKTLHI